MHLVMTTTVMITSAVLKRRTVRAFRYLRLLYFAAARHCQTVAASAAVALENNSGGQQEIT